MTKKLQVFVSSTYNDLKEERQAAVAAILKSGHIPAGMELFTSGDQSQLETIKGWIDESDVYMLILGGRYGSLDPASGLSYTEVEYDYARAQGKPMFAVVITDSAIKRKVQAGGPDFIETMNGAKLAAFRTKVLSYISSFFDDEKDIKLTVYESLADFVSRKELVGWVRGNTVVDNLPLFEEIKKLSDENTQLRSKLAEAERRSKLDNSDDKEFNEVCEVLRSTKVTVPKDIGKNGPFDIDLLSLFVQTQEAFCTGVDNRVGMSDSASFLFYTVAPKLQIHGLVANEKIAGVRYRRFAVTPKGTRFLSEFAKRQARVDASKASSGVRNDEMPVENNDAPVPEAPRTSKARPRTKKPAPEKD